MDEKTNNARPMARYANSKWSTAHDHGVVTFGATQPILSALEIGGFEVRDLFLMGMDEDYGAIIVEDRQRAEEVAAALEPAYKVTIAPEDPEGRTDRHWSATYTLARRGGAPARMLTNLKPLEGGLKPGDGGAGVDGDAGFDDTDAVLTAAKNDLRAQAPRVWAAPSGSPVSGEQIATHLEAAAELMEARNWAPEELFAAIAVAQDGHGDGDTLYLARHVLQALLRARLGAPWISYEAWSEHADRTLPEVVGTLRTAARLAREAGPAPRG